MPNSAIKYKFKTWSSNILHIPNNVNKNMPLAPVAVNIVMTSLYFKVFSHLTLGVMIPVMSCQILLRFLMI
jgi:hypothetical protein